MKTLTNRQFSALGSVAHKAFDKLQRMGYDCGAFDEWRAEVTADTCGGRSSWKTLLQADYIPLYNTFAKMAGVKEHADNTPKDDAAALINTLRDRLSFWEAAPAYVARIVRDKTGRKWVTASTSYDVMFTGLDADTLRQLLYTLERALRNLSKRDAAKLGLDAPTECHGSRSTVPPARLAARRGDTIAANHEPARRKPAARP